MKLYGRKKVKVSCTDDDMLVDILANEEKLKDSDSESSDDSMYLGILANQEKTGNLKTREGAFLRHDKERFTQYLENVKNGVSKINTTGLEPHKLVEYYLAGNAEDATIECQWKTIIEKLKSNGNLQNSMALVDVSGSMNGEPMNVAIGLGLIVANLTHEPFGKKFISFSETPQVINITGNSLREQVLSIKESNWNGITNFVLALELILNIAKFNNILDSEMIKTFFVFTDMQFDSAFSGSENTLYENVKKMYNENQYTMPKIVFWNLRSSEKDAFPITISTSGTAFVSGFSAELLKVFMECGGDFNPMNIFMQFIDRYLKEVVIDETEKDLKF